MLLNARLFYVTSDYINATLLIYLPLFIKTYYKFDGIQYGNILFIAGLFAILGVLIAPVLINYFKNRKIIIIIENLLMIFGIVMMCFSSNYLIIFVATGLCYLNRMAMYSIGDDINNDFALSINISFSKIRSFGSIGWGIAFITNSYLIINYPQFFLVVWLIISSLACLNLIYIKENHNNFSNNYRFVDIIELFKFKNTIKYFILGLIIYVLMYCIPIFINLYLLENNISITNYSYFGGVLVILEFIIMFFSLRIAKFIKDNNYILIIGILLVFKLLLIISANDLLIYASCIIDPFIFGMILPFNPFYLKKSIEVKYHSLVLILFGLFTLLIIAIVNKLMSLVLALSSINIVLVVFIVIAWILVILTLFFKIDNLIE